MISKIVLAVFVTVLSLTAQATPTIQHWNTANGTKVLFVAAPELAMLDISIVFDAGAARDGDIPGTALLTNSMLNEGAAGLNADQIAAKFEDVGARFTNTSARDMAVLGLRSLTEQSALESALTMFGKVLTQPDFPVTAYQRLQKQMLMGLRAEKQSPAAIASRAFYHEMYGTHPYASMPIGNEQSVSRLTLDALKTFYHRYYVAKNAVIVLVGAVDLTKAKQISEQLSSGLSAGSSAKALAPVMPLKQAKTVIIEHPSTQTHILMGQPGISRHDPDYFALYVGNHILGGSGLVSQLSNEVREKRGLSYSVYSYFRPMRELGPYQFGLQTRNDQAEEALTVMKDTLMLFSKNGPTEAELVAAKQNIIGGFALRLDSNSKIADYLAMIGFYSLPLDYLDTFKSNVNAVTVKQIKEAYSRRVHADNMMTVLVGGKAE